MIAFVCLSFSLLIIDNVGIIPIRGCKVTYTANYEESASHEQECGFTSLKKPKLTKVVGGRRAKLGEWPWIAALGYTPPFGKDPFFQCGGTLISARHVLTAAHCAYDRNDLIMVRIGDLNLELADDGAKPVDCNISKVVIHEKYDQDVLENDIAILVLERNVEFTQLVHPVCLPTDPELNKRIFDGTSLYAAGWGMTDFPGTLSQDLMQVQVPLVPLDKCKKALKIIESVKIDSRVMCAGHMTGGKDVCKGDSGGPLVFMKNNTGYIIGLVSFGYNCAEPGYPGAYTRVSAFLDWILSKLNE